MFFVIICLLAVSVSFILWIHVWWSDSILEEGAECASQLAEQTLLEVKRVVGLL
jgi:hypothetical protein